jgi:hypothetical protein
MNHFYTTYDEQYPGDYRCQSFEYTRHFRAEKWKFDKVLEDEDRLSMSQVTKQRLGGRRTDTE